MNMHPHVIFSGQCKEAFERYAAILGGKVLMLITYGDTPMGDGLPADLRDRVAHARLQIGDQLLLGADAPPDRYRPPAGFSLMVEVATPEEATRVFSSLAEQGKIDMPLQETFWAHRFGSCTDRYGVLWMVNCGKPLEGLVGARR